VTEPPNTEALLAKVREYRDKTDRAKWSTAREETRMGKSGYAPKKAQLAELMRRA
jgi:hypothetical protein